MAPRGAGACAADLAARCDIITECLPQFGDVLLSLNLTIIAILAEDYCLRRLALAVEVVDERDYVLFAMPGRLAARPIQYV